MGVKILMVLKGIIFFKDFNPTVRNNWMSVKLWLVPIHGGVECEGGLIDH